MYADNSNNMTQTYDRKAKSEKRKTLTHFLTHSLAHSDTYVFMYADNSYNMTQTYDRKAKNEKRKAKNEKQKTKWI